MTIFVDMANLADTSAGYQLRVLRSPADVEAAAAAWQALERRYRGEMAYFQTFDWCSNWLNHVARNIAGCEPYVVTVWQGSALMAVVPLMLIRVAGGVRVLSALGEPHTQYAGMLLSPDASTPAVASLIRSCLADPRGCDALHIQLLPAGSPLADMLDRSDRDQSYANQSSSLDLGQFNTPADFLEDADPKKRRKRLQRRQKIEKEFGELRLRTVWGGEPEFAELVHLCVQMKRDWITRTGRISTGFSIPGYADFLSQLHGDPQAREGGVAFVKQAGGRIIAIEVSMIRHGHLYAYIGGFDWDLRKYSPGKVQMEATVCWAIDNGLKAYDLLGNVAGYKDSWSNICCELVAYNRSYTARGWLYGSAWTSLRPRLKRLYEALPSGLRQWAAATRAT